MIQHALEISGTSVPRGSRRYIPLPVARLLSGQELSIPLHVLAGANPGPTLGITAVIHGVEYPPIRVIREILTTTDPQRLSGTIVAIPVANPIAFARFSRITPERDVDIANLNRVFPGGVSSQEHGTDRHPSDVGLTERMAAVIVEHFFPHIDALVDFHCTQEPRALRVVLQRKDPEGDVGRRTTELGRVFGMGIIELQTGSRHPGSCSGYAAARGIPSCVAEVGGGYLSRRAEDMAVALGVRGVRNVMKHLRMLDGNLELPTRQLVVEKRVVLRPKAGGYFLAEIEAEDILGAEAGMPVRAGQQLGKVIDPYSLEILEEQVSPVDGVVYVVRRTGLCEAGDRGLGIGVFEGSRWI